jgi:hypothetical protein
VKEEMCIETFVVRIEGHSNTFDRCKKLKVASLSGVEGFPHQEPYDGCSFVH